MQILKQQRIQNLNIINFIENNHIYGCKQIGESIIVRGRSDQDWVYISCFNENEFQELLKHLTIEDKCFGALDKWMIPIITKNKNVLWSLDTQMYYLPEGVKVPKPIYIVNNLTTEDAETIYNNSDYKEYLSVEFISERISKGVGKGIFVNDELIAWGLTHDDGSLGYLHVKDKNRRKGYGLSVMLDLIQEVRRQGKIPFGCIEPGNEKSLSLINKLGFVYQRDCIWFEME